MARLCWLSDYCDGPTGFGTVARNVIPGLMSLGHEVFHLALAAPAEGVRDFGEWGRARVTPITGRPYGEDCLGPFIRRHRIEGVIANMDTPWVAYLHAPESARAADADALRGVPRLVYQPIDGTGPRGILPAPWRAGLAAQAQAHGRPLLYNAWSADVARASADCDPQVIPHGVDPVVYAPRERGALRTALFPESLSGAFLVGSVMANRCRKGFPELFEGFRRFVYGETAAHPAPVTDAYLYVHAPSSSPVGFDLEELAHVSGIAPRFVRPPQPFRPLPESAIAALYTALDVHALVTRGEGFGLPHLEAQCAGVPSLATACTGLDRITADPHLLVPTRGVCHDGPWALGHHLTDESALAERLALLYLAWKSPQGLAPLAPLVRDFAAQKTWASTLPLWQSALDAALA